MPGPRHLYLHVPFCRSRCAYCAFYSTTGATPSLLDRYVDGILVELDQDPPGGPWDTVYLGGGTPSLLGARRVARLLGSLPLTGDAECTVEANPEGLRAGDAAAYRDAGVNRLSLGVQSFDDGALRTLGRPHDAATALAAVAEARAAGLRVSLDLIYGLPGQDAQAWTAQLDVAADTGVEHLSAYELSLEPETPLAAAWPDGLGDRAALFFATHEHLAARGFDGYEVSNFARSERARSRHNLATWAHRAYLGLGPGAHSYLETASGSVRRWNHPDLAAWLAALEGGDAPPRGVETLDAGQRLLERVMLGVRTRDGVDLAALREACGEDAACALLRHAAGPIGEGLLAEDGAHLRPTLQGMALADRLALLLTQ